MSLDALFVAAQSGEPAARRALVVALYASRRYVERRCRHSPLEAEDLVQATLVVLYRKLDGFVPTHAKAFEGLIYDTARTIISTKYRSP